MNMERKTVLCPGPGNENAQVFPTSSQRFNLMKMYLIWKKKATSSPWSFSTIPTVAPGCLAPTSMNAAIHINFSSIGLGNSSALSTCHWRSLTQNKWWSMTTIMGNWLLRNSQIWHIKMWTHHGNSFYILELPFNLMRLFVRSWFPRIFQHLVVLHTKINNLLPLLVHSRR